MTGYYKSTWDKGSYTLTQFEVRASFIRIDPQSAKGSLDNIWVLSMAASKW